MTLFTRMQDQRTLDTADLASTTLIDAEGIWDIKNTREYSSGPIGEAIPLSSSIAQKTFTLNFLIGDETGSDQRTVNRFFSKSGWYLMDDEDFQLDPIEFTVVAVDSAFFSGSSGLSVTCQAKYGDLVEVERTLIAETTLSGTGEFYGFNELYFNETKSIAELVLTITASDLVIWQSGTEITMSNDIGGRLTARIGKTGPDGSLYATTGYQWVLNSFREIVEGEGVILPLSATFFKVQPGETTRVLVSRFGGLTNSDSTDISVKLEAVSVKQKDEA